MQGFATKAVHGTQALKDELGTLRSPAPRRPRGILGHARADALVCPARGRSRLADPRPPVCTRAHARRRVCDHAHLSNVDLQASHAGAVGRDARAFRGAVRAGDARLGVL